MVLKRALQETNGFDIGSKFASSLVFLSGGGRNFGPHIRTQLKVEYPPGLLEYNSDASDAVSKAEQSTVSTMPLNLSLWDFAGQELYYNTHHTFMSVHAVYIIVFSLVHFSKDTGKQMERIQFG